LARVRGAADIRTAAFADLPDLLLSRKRPVVDLNKYADSIIKTFGTGLQITEAMPVESSFSDKTAFKEPQLSEIFVPQDVVICEDSEVASLEASHAELSVLPENMDLADSIQRHREVHSRLEYRAKKSIDNLLAALSTRFSAVLGDPGAGKSSAFRDYALRWAASLERSSSPLPILVELNQFSRWLRLTPGGTILQYVATGGSVSCKMDEAALEARCKSHTSQTVLLLDGLDEVFDVDLRALVIRQVTLLANESGCGVWIVLTSRIIGYDPGKLSPWGFRHFMMQPFTMEQIGEFIQKWHLRTYADTPSLIELRNSRAARLQAAVQSIPSIRQLAKNPLLLTMIAIVNRGPELPTVRIRLYDKCTELMLQAWHAQLALERAEVFGKHLQYTPFGLDQKRALLEDVAWSMQTDGDKLGTIMLQSNLLGFCKDHVARVLGASGATVGASAVVDGLRERHGVICFLGDRAYAFAHRSFLEYFCACALAHKLIERDITDADLCKLFCVHASHSEWAEVLILTCGMVPGACVGQLLQVLLDAGQVLLAARCLEQVADRRKAETQVESVRLALVDYAGGSTDWPGSEASQACYMIARLWNDNKRRDSLLDIACKMHSPGFDAAVLMLLQYYIDDTDVQRFLSTVREFNFVTYGPPTEARITLLHAMQSLPALESLRLIPDAKVFAELAAALRSAPRLDNLDLGSCELNAQVAELVADALASVPQLTGLKMNGASFGGSSATLVARGLTSLKQLQRLEITGRGVTAEVASALLPGIASLPQLSVLDLGYTSIGDEGSVALAAALASMPQLQRLQMSNTNMGDVGAVALAAALPSMPQLDTLNLNGTNIQAIGAIAVANALARMPSSSPLIIRHDGYAEHYAAVTHRYFSNELYKSLHAFVDD
jgi:hypothetical protein